jgi:hypothetical protein
VGSAPAGGGGGWPPTCIDGALRARPSTWGEFIAATIEYLSGVFDLRAAATFVWPYKEGPKAYRELLTEHVAGILAQLVAQQLPVADELIPKLTTRLRERQADWMAQAYAAYDQRQHTIVRSDAAGPPNKARVDGYIAEVRRVTGRKLTKRDLWRDHYDEATEFERWQRGDKRTTHKARQVFEKLLRDRPHLKP